MSAKTYVNSISQEARDAFQRRMREMTPQDRAEMETRCRSGLRRGEARRLVLRETRRQEGGLMGHHTPARRKSISMGVSEFHRLRRIEEHPYFQRACMDGLDREQREYWLRRYMYDEDPELVEQEYEPQVERIIEHVLGPA